MASEPCLTATWPDGRAVEPGADALAFLIATATSLDENSDDLFRLIRTGSDASRVLLKLLGLTREAISPTARTVGRPKDRDRQELILLVVSALIEDGHPLPEAYARAAHLLANPELRAKQRIGTSARPVTGNGHLGRPMSPESVRNAYRKAREAAVYWYFGVIDEAALTEVERQLEPPASS